MYFLSYSEIEYDELNGAGKVIGSDCCVLTPSAGYPLLLSPNGERFLSGEGEIYNVSSFDFIDSIKDFHDGIWLENGEIIVTSDFADAKFQRYDSNFNFVSSEPYPVKDSELTFNIAKFFEYNGEPYALVQVGYWQYPIDEDEFQIVHLNK